ncbi:caspase family protein [Fuerstiella marisgermanici]|uniref:Peptidase C14 caspase domain-containing protein n=1 Tax=Fuerstiella marisgermanici TaxID=1891926 RepID=A0A1P8WGQ3_9PLAN|nr:caspase family protein [Fuerstiella marisgermanici]APZ93238.1 putative protein containing caspase domain protein [Fuerstiella marisgermanici]
MKSLYLVSIFVMATTGLPADEPQPQPQPQLQTVTQSGHPGLGGFLTFDPSGTYLAVASKISPDVTLWHVPTRTLMARFRSARSYNVMPTRLEFLTSPETMVLESPGLIEWWRLDMNNRGAIMLSSPELRDGKLIDTPADRLAAFGASQSRKWKAMSRVIDGVQHSAVFSMDDKVQHPLPLDMMPDQFGFSHDDRLVVIVESFALKVWDFTAGKLVREIKGENLSFQSADFSPAGKNLMVQARDQGSPIHALFRISSGERILTAPDNLQTAPFVLSADDKTAYTCQQQGQSVVIHAKDLDSGRTQQLFTVPDNAAATALAVHSEMGIIALTSNDYFGQTAIKLYDAESGAAVGELRNHIEAVNNLFVDSANKRIIENSNSGTYLWNPEVAERSQISIVAGGQLVMAHNGRLLKWGTPLGKRTVMVSTYATQESGHTAEVKQRIELYKDTLNQPNPIFATPEMSFVAAGDGADIVWCELKSKTVKRLTRKNKDDSPSGQITKLAVSDDGERVLIADAEGSIERWNVAESVVDASVSGPWYKSAVYENASSVYGIVAAGNDFVIAGEFGVSRFTDDGTAIPIQPLNPSASIVRAADGTTLAWINLRQKVIQIYDAANSKLTTAIPMTDSSVMSITFGLNPNELYVLKDDGSAELWHADSAQHVATFATTRAGSFIVSTPDGFYKSDRESTEGIGFRVGSDMFLAEQFDVSRNRPDIVLERIGHADEETLDAYRTVTQWRQKRGNGNSTSGSLNAAEIPKISFAERPPSLTRDATVRFSIHVDSGLEFVESLHVSVNHVPVIELPKSQVSETQSATVDLVSGTNRIDVWAETPDGRRGWKTTHIVTCQKPVVQARTWFIGIGVSDYDDDEHDLRYAAKDAADLGATLKNLSNGPCEVQIITDKQATHATVVKRVQESLRRAAVQDLVVLFFAGHGVAEDGEYRFALHGCDFDQPDVETLTFEQIEKLLTGCKARNRIILIDSCHAGDSLPVGIRRQQTDNAAEVIPRAASIDPAPPSASAVSLRKLLLQSFAGVLSKSGAAVITASDGSQYALESARWKNGAFTYVVREGLTDRKADLNEDQQITAEELHRYVTQRVTELTQGAQIPQQKRETEFDPVILKW